MRSKFAPWLVFLLAVFLSSVWCFIFYPHLEKAFDPDYWGALGRGIYYNQTLSFYPDEDPTVQRGPVYPLIIAAAYIFPFPAGLQFIQCLIFGATAAIAYWTGKKLYNEKAGFAAALLVALHPILIWYTSRIWIETTAIFLFTAIIAASAAALMRPSFWRAAFCGALIGAASLTKATFFPLVFVLFLFLWAWKDKKGAFAALIFAAAVVAPWTARNYAVTGELIPVHTLAGYNFQRGDDFADHFAKAPFSYEKQWELSHRANPLFQDEKQPKFEKEWQHEVWFDKEGIERSFSRYLENPLFFLKKMGINLFAFWFLGSSPKNTFVFFVLQGTLLFFFARAFKGFKIASIEALLPAMALLYYVEHLPIFAFARLSAVLIPAMIIFSFRRYGRSDRA